MTDNEILRICEKAFKEDKVRELLLGEDGYRCLPGKSVPANIPTDWSRVFEVGIYKMTEIPKEEIKEKLIAALLSLLEGSEIDVWVAFRVFFVQLYKEKNNISPLHILNGDIEKQLSNALYEKENELKQCHFWQGKNRTNGLWSDIEGANVSMNHLFGVNLI